MIFELRILVRTLILPPACLLLLGIAGLVLARRHRRLGVTLAAVAPAALWLLSTPIIALGLEKMASRYPALDLSGPVNAQAIVILGGGGYRELAPEFGGPAPEYLMYDRLAYGAYLARRMRLPVLVTGDGIEAIAMQDSLRRDFGVPGLDIVPAPADVPTPVEVGSMRFVPTANGLLRSYLAVYELVGGGVRDLLVATHLRRAIR